MTTITDQTARDIARACDFSRFERVGYDAKACAQRNLSGRSHYADDDTLRFFHSRIQTARPECNGLLFVLVESVAADMRNTSRGFRFVVFNLFGEVVNDRPSATPETLLKSTAKAQEAAAAWLETFDTLGHYRAALRDRAATFQRRAAALADCAATL